MQIVRLIFIMLLGLITPVVIYGQTRTFTADDVEYELDLPTAEWRVASRFDIHRHVEFVNGLDPLNGYLRLRKSLVHPGMSAPDLFRREEKWELERLPGYVRCSDCRGEIIEGHIPSAVFSYEYVSDGRVLYGRIYYFHLEGRIFYSLRFTAAREKLPEVSAQFDAIARSFRRKMR